MNTQNEKTNSHPEFSSGSKDYGFRNKFGMTKSGERGRSMVEMLGVLAIVGVLSIAGVSGYTTAMKKHRANELLNEASKRAVVLAMKIAAGQDIEHGLDEFDSNTVNGATFSNPSAPAGNTFSMSLTGVDADVCEQMEVMMGTDGMMNIGKECTNNTCSLTLTFNKDLSKGVTSGASEPTLVESCTTGTAISNIGDTTNERTEAGDCRCPTATPQWDGSKCKEADTNIIGRTDAESEAPILWSPDAKS